MKSKINPNFVLMLSLSIVFIAFGILKVFNISPVRNIVEQSLFIFKYEWAFILLGLGEVSLGMGLLFKKTRKYAALFIILHLIGTIVTALIHPSLTFNSETVITVHGEFVLKNIVLIAVAWHIYNQTD